MYKWNSIKLLEDVIDGAIVEMLRNLAFRKFVTSRPVQLNCLEHEVNTWETWNCICNIIYYGFNFLSSHASKWHLEAAA